MKKVVRIRECVPFSIVDCFKADILRAFQRNYKDVTRAIEVLLVGFELATMIRARDDIRT